VQERLSKEKKKKEKRCGVWRKEKSRLLPAPRGGKIAAKKIHRGEECAGRGRKSGQKSKKHSEQRKGVERLNGKGRKTGAEERDNSCAQVEREDK